MAFIGDFSKVAEFFSEMDGTHPLVRFQEERSGVKCSEIKTLDDLRKVKPLSKRELSEMQGGRIPAENLFQFGFVTKIFKSPGPIFNLKGEEYEHFRFYKALEQAGFLVGDIVLNSFSYHMSPAGDMFDEACAKIGCAVIPMGTADSTAGADLIKETSATAFIGTRTYLLKCLEKLGDENTVTKAYLIAEKLTEDDRRLFRETFGVSVYQGYGTAELGLISTEHEDLEGMHVDTDAQFLEILDPQTWEPVQDGEIGEVVVTFMNRTTPYLRLATGDLSMTAPGSISDKRDEGKIAGIFGRSDASVKVKGVFIHYWQVETFMRDELGSEGVLDVFRDETGSDALKVVLKSGDESSVATAFKERFGLRLNEVQIDDTIEKTEVRDRREHLKER
ncbi:phenylacetate--CoA ligase family protein [Limisalsivibrio acetivorans]|uniref:phenylacetate--CoA ligase family protein n=1 Tax=Limisalsivibrio acetivorans TaxID=1304888 RepID=UPI0003B44461|nr:AMP-binding protein [Limisalsivibrio acetivorans]